MIYEIRKAHVLYSVDEDGRRLGAKGYFSKKPHAGVWEGTHEVNILVIDGKAFLLERAEPIDLDGKLKARNAEIRERALKKLSEAERVALGLSDDSG